MYDISRSSVKTRAVPVDIGTANGMGAIQHVTYGQYEPEIMPDF